MLDTRISYPDKYKSALKGYYNDIFGPFAAYVRAGLGKLAGLAADTVCVSHGPALTASGFLGYALKMYGEWSAQQPAPPPEVKRLPVFYCSAYGYTARIAERAVAEIKKAFPRAETAAYNIIESDLGDLAAIMNGSDGFMIGSPTLNRDAVPPVRDLLARIDAINMQKKPIGVFGSYGWSGEAVPSIIAGLAALRFNVVGEGFKVNFNPSETELEKMTEYAKEFCAKCAAFRAVKN
jgi:flavorubredoxin